MALFGAVEPSASTRGGVGTSPKVALAFRHLSSVYEIVTRVRLGDLSAAETDADQVSVRSFDPGYENEDGSVTRPPRAAEGSEFAFTRAPSSRMWVPTTICTSRSAMLAKMALARRCRELPALGEALGDGRIGTAGATLIGRIADADTAARWVERAASRTYVHLREEVEAAGLLARVSGDRAWLEPPDDETLAAIHEVERAALAPEAEHEPEHEHEHGMRTRTRVSGCMWRSRERRAGRLGKVPWRVTVAADLADMWTAVRRVHSKRSDGRGFVRTLSDNILRF